MSKGDPGLTVRTRPADKRVRVALGKPVPKRSKGRTACGTEGCAKLDAWAWELEAENDRLRAVLSTLLLEREQAKAAAKFYKPDESLKQVELLKRERLRDSLRVKDAEAALDAGGDRERELRVQLEDSEKQAKWLEQQMSVLKVQVQSLLSENVALKTSGTKKGKAVAVPDMATQAKVPHTHDGAPVDIGGQGAHRSNGSSNQHTHNHKAGGHGTKVWSCCLSPTQAAALSLRGGGNRKGGRNRQGGTLRGNALAHTLSARSGLRRTPSHRAATPTRSLRRPQSATLTRAYAYNSPGAFLGYTADSTRRTGKRRSQRPVLPL